MAGTCWDHQEVVWQDVDICWLSDYQDGVVTHGMVALQALDWMARRWSVEMSTFFEDAFTDVPDTLAQIPSAAKSMSKNKQIYMGCHADPYGTWTSMDS